MVNVSNNFIDQYMLCGSIYSIMGFLPMIVWQLAPASRWGLSFTAPTTQARRTPRRYRPGLAGAGRKASILARAEGRTSQTGSGSYRRREVSNYSPWQGVKGPGRPAPPR